MLSINLKIFAFFLVLSSLQLIIFSSTGAAQTACNDSTVYGQCSVTKPFYCNNGELVTNCATCGCPTNFTCVTNQCLTVECTPGEQAACGTSKGICETGIKTCKTDYRWGDCVGGVGSAQEVCDGVDNNCDGNIDEGLNCLCKNGETRQCGSSNVGECGFGTSLCSNGQWSECIGAVTPQQEVCNGKDDNCDGIIDNVNNGNSLESTQCQCYGGTASSQKETCNGIDDDCDGRIDENSECCTAGESRECGTSLGVCEKGISICGGDYLWGPCIDEVRGEPYEICGNDQDDDCDGRSDQYDSDCKACTNGVQDEIEQGSDCGGPCATPCFDIPWLIIITAATIVIVIIIFVVYPAMVKNSIEVRKI